MSLTTNKTIIPALLLGALLCLLVCQEVLTLPAAKDIGMKNLKPRESNENVEFYEKLENNCDRKGGKFCEIICKNNPSEGGKMCNCDTFALKNNKNMNCRYPSL